MILTITGTRRGLTAAQRAALPLVLATWPARLVHGGAVGVDSEVDAFVRERAFGVSIEVYPASGDDRWRYWLPHRATGTVVHAPRPPLDRNRAMVRAGDHVLALPATAREAVRSGTWATVRYARIAGRPITIVFPDGTVREEPGR